MTVFLIAFLLGNAAGLIGSRYLNEDRVLALVIFCVATIVTIDVAIIMKLIRG